MSNRHCERWHNINHVLNTMFDKVRGGICSGQKQNDDGGGGDDNNDDEHIEAASDALPFCDPCFV